MSHIATIDLEVKDLVALQSACNRLGVEFRQNQKQFRTFGGRSNPCDAAICLKDNPQAYEIGLLKRTDGRSGYLLNTDFWAGGKGLVAAVGQNACRLRQVYAIEASKAKARRSGQQVQERTLPNGAIQLTVG